MVQINFARKEINCKIVYYGPGLSGKTTSLEVVHARTPDGNRGELTSISTDGDRTLFFDFMPLDLGKIAGMNTKFHLYTVPGQVYYNSTRKLVLLGADGVIFVADSTPGRMDDNLQSMENLRQNLAEMGRDLNKIPLVIQYNKRDLPSATTLEELQSKLNPNEVPHFEASAKTGEGIFQTLKAISALVLEDINSNDKRVTQPAARRTPPARAPAEGAAPSSSTATATAPAPSTVGILPERDPKQVLRPAATRSEPASREAPVEPLPEGSSRSSQQRTTVGRSRAALARQIQSAEGASAPVVRRTRSRAAAAETSSTGNGKLVLFMMLGILAGAAAAIAAYQLFLQK